MSNLGAATMNWILKVIKAEKMYSIRQKALWPEKSIEHVMVKADELALHIGTFAEDRNASGAADTGFFLKNTRAHS